MSGASRRKPADISDEMTELIQTLAKKTYYTLNCNGVSRIDFLIDQDNDEVYVNEINAIPGSLAFYLWEPTGKSFTELTNDLIRLALKRNREKENLVFSYESNILAARGHKGLKNSHFIIE